MRGFQTKTEREGAEIEAGRLTPSPRASLAPRMAETGRSGRRKVREFLERSKNLASYDGWEKGEKKPNWPSENSATRETQIGTQEWTTFLEPSKSKHVFGLSRGLSSFGRE